MCIQINFSSSRICRYASHKESRMNENSFFIQIFAVMKIPGLTAIVVLERQVSRFYCVWYVQFCLRAPIDREVCNFNWLTANSIAYVTPNLPFLCHEKYTRAINICEYTPVSHYKRHEPTNCLTKIHHRNTQITNTTGWTQVWLWIRLCVHTLYIAFPKICYFWRRLWTGW